MTSKQYRAAAVALCREFSPVSEKVWDDNWREFKFSGWTVGLHFSHRLKLTRTLTWDWVSIGIQNPRELPPFCDHWKWNILVGGEQGLEVLRYRLTRLTAHYAQPVRESHTQSLPLFTPLS